MLNIEEGLTFDDVLLKPKYSEINSRADVDLKVQLPKGFELKIPIVSANMKHVTETKMANALGEMGGLALLHRFGSVEEQLNMFANCAYPNNVGCSVGIKEQDKEAIKKFVKAGCKIICVDVAHAHNKNVIDFCNSIYKEYSDILFIVGCIATKAAAKQLYECADIVRINLGNGSICSTRLNAGVGVPQLTAISNCYEIYNKTPFKENEDTFQLMADGGCRIPADFVKSLCFSHCVMTGNTLAGTDEAPGEKVYIDGKAHKQYAGSSTFKDRHVEGFTGLVPCKGPVQKVIEKILEGIRSGCSYQGVSNLKDLKKDPRFYRITNAGLKESHAHDIILGD